MTFARLLRISGHRARSLLRKDTVDAEVAQELAFHVDRLVDEAVAAGVPLKEARRAALRSLGNVAVLEEECRDHRGVQWLHDLGQDLGYGLRMLRKHRGFTAVVTVSLAIGIGANTATLSVIDAVMFGGLPLRDADRLVSVRTFALNTPNENNNASYLEYSVWRTRSQSFESLGTSIADQGEFASDGDAVPERIAGRLVDPAFFTTLGVAPLVGRTLTFPDSQESAADPAVVISHRLWLRRYHGDGRIIGRRVGLNGETVTIVGVMPSQFRFPADETDYWAPIREASGPRRNVARFFQVYGRLKDGVTREQAEAELVSITQQIGGYAAERQQGRSIRLQSLRDSLYGWATTPLATLQAGMLLVLLIACANVAGLLLARGTTRGPEIAMRMALGAGRGRIVRQLIGESLLLTSLGFACGLLVAWWGITTLTRMNPFPGSLRIPSVTGPRLLMIATLLTLVTGALLALVPALALSKRYHPTSLKEGPRVGLAPRVHRLRSALVSAQLALAVVLLIATGLLVNSLARLSGRDLNFESHRLLLFELRIAPLSYVRPAGSFRGYTLLDVASTPVETFERTLAQLRTVPGAQAVAGVSYAPVTSFIIPRVKVSAGDAEHLTAYFLVTPHFFTTIQAEVVRGREIDTRDVRSNPWTAVVNETMAHRLWPGEDPIGKRLLLTETPDERPREVVGVVRDIPLGLNQVRAEPAVYTSYTQQPSRYAGPWAGMFGHMVFMIRAANAPMALAPAVRNVVNDVLPGRPPVSPYPIDALLDAALRGRHLYVFVLGIFACAATALASIGVYGVTAYAVTQRTREIGIRLALGAHARDVLTLVGGGVAKTAVIGLLLGVAGAMGATRLIATQLWGITATDPATFSAVALVLTLVTLVACWIPVRRALRVDPNIALRCE
jgi:putative ABC transport system permease protein